MVIIVWLCVFILLFYAWLFFFCVKRLKKPHSQQEENRKLLKDNLKYKKELDVYAKKNHEKLNKLMKGIEDEIQRLRK